MCVDVALPHAPAPIRRGNPGGEGAAEGAAKAASFTVGLAGESRREFRQAGPAQAIQRCTPLWLDLAHCSAVRGGSCSNPRGDRLEGWEGMFEKGSPQGPRVGFQRMASFDELSASPSATSTSAGTLGALCFLNSPTDSLRSLNDEGVFTEDNLNVDVEAGGSAGFSTSRGRWTTADDKGSGVRVSDAELRLACLRMVDSVMQTETDVLDEALGDLDDSAEGVREAGRHSTEALQFHLQGCFRMLKVSKIPRNRGCLALSSLAGGCA